MTYDYDHYTTDGERHIATGQELIDRGFTVYEMDEIENVSLVEEGDIDIDSFLARTLA